MPRKLRSVGPDEVPKPRRHKKTMIQAAEDGDDVALYEALRIRLVEAINDARTPSHAIAPLSRALAQATDAIDRLVMQREVDARTEAVAGDESWDAGAI
jgi:hypothetical protein